MAYIKYVAGDGTGDYNCDGTNDNIQIQQALDYADDHYPCTVYLKGPFVYEISSPIEVSWYTTLRGDSSAVLKLKDNAGWSSGTPIIDQMYYDIENVEIYGFEIDGNADNQPEDRGDDYYRLISFFHAYNIKIHDMYFHDGLADGFRTKYSGSIKFYNNRVIEMGHDGCYYEYTEGGEIYGNYTEIRSNSAHRVKDTSDVKIHDNTMKPYALTSVSGNPGIQVEDSSGDTYNIEIYNNVLTDCWGEGMWIIERDYGYTNQAKNLYIHHNTIRSAGHITTIDYNAGITIQGFSGARIEHNVIDTCYNAGILCRYSPIISGKSIYISYNTVSSTQLHQSSVYAASNANWCGCGVVNLYPSRYTMVLYGNIVSGSSGPSNYYGVSSENDIIVESNPRYVPPIRYTQQEMGINYYIAGRSAYINGYPFYWTDKKIDVDKVICQLKSPGIDGWSIEDFGFQGADITLDCFATSLDDVRNVLAAFYQEGRSVLELGGIYDGWQIYGYCKNHSTNLRLSDQTYTENYPYSVLFIADQPVMESTIQRVRGKRITESGEEWSSDDIFAGNIIKNYSFENWTNVETGLTWDSRTTPADNEWRAICWSPELVMFAAVGQTGVDNRVMTSSDGITWTSQTSPSNNWRAICWSPALGMFAAVGISGTGNRVMTSTDGITWTNQTTPADNNWTGIAWSPGLAMFAAVGVTGTGDRIMTSTDGATWVTQTSPADINWVAICWSPDLAIFCSVAYGTGASLAMTSSDGTLWVQRTTPLDQQWVSVCWSSELELFVAVSEDGTTQQVMTSSDGITWTARDTPETIQWRSVVWAPEISIFVAVGISGTGQRAMYSENGITWTMINTAADNNWYSLAWSPSLRMLAAVSATGTDNRAMTSDNYGTTQLENAAPDDWTLVEDGQARSEDAYADLYSVMIVGDGTSGTLGKITQPVDPEDGLMYILSGQGKITGLTSGYLQADIYAGGMVISSIVWAENCDWTFKSTTMFFDTIPTDAEARVFAGGTPNDGATLYLDNLVFQKVSDFEVADVGNDVLTLGTINVVPDYIISAAPLEGGEIGGSTYSTTDSATVYSTASTSYLLQKTITLTGKLWKSFRVDQIQVRLMGQSSYYYAYCKVTIQADSLYGGAETSLAEWNVKSTSYVTKTATPNLTADANETVVLKFYIKTANATYRAYIRDLNYIYTELGSTASVTNVQLYNTRDPLTVLHAANNLFPGGTVSINSDQTGWFKYSENFADATYVSVVYSRAGDSYSGVNGTVTLASGGSLVYGFDTRYPVTGIPYIVLYVLSGSPQVSIAEDDDGEPGLFYSVDDNDTDDVTDEQIYRNLDNIDNIRLNGKSIWYVKVTPEPGESCVIGSLYIYSDLITVDAERPKIYATGEANTFHITMDEDAPMTITLKYRDAHRVI